MKSGLPFAAVARGGRLQSERLKEIKDDIIAHIADERLSVTFIARRHGVTPRSMRLLFEAEGVTFSEYVVEQRLVRAASCSRRLNFPIGRLAQSPSRSDF